MVLQDANTVTCFTDFNGVNCWTDFSGNTLCCDPIGTATALPADAIFEVAQHEHGYQYGR